MNNEVQTMSRDKLLNPRAVESQFGNNSQQFSSQAQHVEGSNLHTPIYYDQKPKQQRNKGNQEIKNRSFSQPIKQLDIKTKTPSQPAQRAQVFAQPMGNTPSMPGKYQRILVNKKRGVSSSAAANRAFQRSQYLNNSYQQDYGNQTFTSFPTSYTDSKCNKSFGTSQRFDSKQNMKEIFNRDPAPGSYSVSTTDTSQMTVTPSMSNRGLGNGFVSTSNRFVQIPIDRERDPEITIGPGQYEPKKQERHIQVPKLEPKAGFNLPFNERNPLNYCKPITVNIYFKQQNPGVGAYEPEKQFKNVPNSQHVFNSKVERQENSNVNRYNVKFPGPDTYSLPYGFDLTDKEKDAGTRQFRPSIPKKIVPVNLYNPHQDVDRDEVGGPGPGKYDILGRFDKPKKKEGDEEEEIEQKLNQIPNGKLYVENNLDRFGLSILPRKPLDVVPGPGYYDKDQEKNQEGEQYDVKQKIKACYLNQAAKITFPEGAIQKVPGPAYYDASLEPKKISYLFNANQRWVNS